MDKSPALLELLSMLREQLGNNSFDVVDHWEIDLCAIGIANPRNHRVLAYLSTFNHQPGFCDVELELPPSSKEVIYAPAGKHWNIEFDEAVRIVREHLADADR